MPYRNLLLATVLLLPLPGSAGQYGQGRHGHHDFPPTVHAFHDLMAPIWHGPSGAERIASICRSAGDLQQRAQAVIDAPAPQGVDAAGWRQSADALHASTATIGERCDSGETGELEQAFGAVHHAFHGLVRHVGHRH